MAISPSVIPVDDEADALAPMTTSAVPVRLGHVPIELPLVIVQVSVITIAWAVIAFAVGARVIAEVAIRVEVRSLARMLRMRLCPFQ